MRGDVLFGALQTSSQGMEIFAQLLLSEVIAHSECVATYKEND